MPDACTSRVATPEFGPPADLAQQLGRSFDDVVRVDDRGVLVVPPERWLEVARTLRDQYGLDFVANLSAVDWIDHFDVVAHFASSAGGAAVAARVSADRAHPVVPSLVGLYPGADFQEREVYDLFGIRFTGHPNLRRILLWEGFDGHPLCKDWHETYYEADQKPLPSRWPDGRFSFGELSLGRFGGNEQYPPGYLADDLRPSSLDTAPVLESEESRLSPDLGSQLMVVNMGPQHPSTHGVFQMRLVLDGETVVDLEPYMGYMHRNHDKIGERNVWLANMPFTDRLDYMSQLGNELGYALGVERLMGIAVPERAQHIRIILCELNRIQSHFWSIGFLLNDLGAFFTPSLYAIEERELMLDLLEMTTGARMMCNYMRFGGVARDLPDAFLPLARRLVFDRLERSVDEMDAFLSGNEVVRERLIGVGLLPPEVAIAYSVSGPVLRASGVPYDVRRADPYSIYDRFDWDVVTRPEGDVYARYLVRLGEIRQSIRILQQALDQLPEGEILAGKRVWQVRVPEGETYSRVENPRGELGYYLVSDGKANPYRYHVRSPCFVNLTSLAEMCKGHRVADVVAILGSIDIVLGEVDR